MNNTRKQSTTIVEWYDEDDVFCIQTRDGAEYDIPVNVVRKYAQREGKLEYTQHTVDARGYVTEHNGEDTFDDVRLDPVGMEYILSSLIWDVVVNNYKI